MSLDDECYPCQTESGLDLDINQTSSTGIFYRNLNFYLHSVPSINCSFGGHSKHYIYSNIVNPRSSFLIKAYHTPLKTTDDHVRALTSARYISEQITIKMRTHVSKRGQLSPEEVEAIRVFPYSSFYLFYEYTDFFWTTIISFGVTLQLVFFAHLLCSALSIPGSMIIILNALLVCAPLASVMYFWNTAGTTASLSFVEICVGVSVRFCTLVVNAFENSTRRRRGERQTQAVLSTSRQVLLGVIGPKIFGLIPLTFASDHEYFRLFTGLCLSGCLHAAFVVPTLIYIMGNNIYSWFDVYLL